MDLRRDRRAAPVEAVRATRVRAREVGSSSAGMNRIKFVGFASQPDIRQAARISAHQHTPEQAPV